MVDSSFFRKQYDYISILIPALPRPTEHELRAGLPWLREENAIERDVSPVHPVTLELVTIVALGEVSPINTLEYESRIAPRLHLCLGYQHGVWLVEHQEEFPEFVDFFLNHYVDLPGLAVIDADGNRALPFLCREGSRRCQLAWYRSGGGLHAMGLLAFAAA